MRFRIGGRRAHTVTVIAIAVALITAAVARTVRQLDDLDAGTVAVVRDRAISQADFDRWYAITARTQSAIGRSVVPDPPSYANCVAALRQLLLAQNTAPPADRMLQDQCSEEASRLRRETMRALLSAEWVRQEAARRGVQVGALEVQSQFDQFRSSFKRKGQFESYLATSGMSLKDLLDQIEVRLLTEKFQQQTQRTEIAESDIRGYFRRNQPSLRLPVRRDLRIIVTKTRGAADRVRVGLANGMPFAEAVSRYSIDQATRRAGGKLLGVVRSSSKEQRALSDQVFDARPGRLTGPVRGLSGWWLFIVDRVRPGRDRTLAEARDQIRQTLEAQQRERAAATFNDRLRARWRPVTRCADHVEVDMCDNGPQPKR